MKTSIALFFFFLWSWTVTISQKPVSNEEANSTQRANALHTTSDSSDIIHASRAGLRISDALNFDEMSLGSRQMVFSHPTSPDTLAIDKSGIGITSTFFSTSNVDISASGMECRAAGYQSYYTPGGIQLRDFGLDTVETGLFPHSFFQEGKNYHTGILGGDIYLSNKLSPHLETKITKDTIQIFKQGIGLLFNELSTLSSFNLDFEYGSHHTFYGAFGMGHDDGIQDISLGSLGLYLKEDPGSGTRVERVSLSKDGLRLRSGKNNVAAEVELNHLSKGGKLTLYDSLDNIHTTIYNDNNGDATMEMNHDGDLRVWLGTFNDFGIINTVGGNGSMNTFLGKADMHNNGNFGGLGVMDDIGIVRAGMEVDEVKNGIVYTNGCYKILDNMANEISCSNEFGYTMYNPLGSETFSLYADILNPNIGNLILNGGNQGLNFRAGANSFYNGNGNTGFAGVMDANNLFKAGMLVNVSDQGILFSDFGFFGMEPDNFPQYALKVQQKPAYGFGIFKDGSSFYEFYINASDNLALFRNNTTIGYFDATTGAYMQTSDRKVKSNVREMDPALERIMTLKPSRYSYNHLIKESRETLGFISQDVESVFPEMVSTTHTKEGEELKAVNYSGMVVVAIKALQEQQKIIVQQEDRINRLENQLDEIKSIIKKQ